MGYLDLLENVEYESHFCSLEDIEEIALNSDEEDEFEKRLEVLDQAIDTVLALCTEKELVVVRLLLSGYKKQEISKFLGISVSQINKVKMMFTEVLASILSKSFNLRVSAEIIDDYIDNIKKEKHNIDRIWRYWIGYRLRVEREIEEEEKRKLIAEINEFRKIGGFDETKN